MMGNLVAGASIYVEELNKNMKPYRCFSINYLTAGIYTLIARGPGIEPQPVSCITR